MPDDFETDPVFEPPHLAVEKDESGRGEEKRRGEKQPFTAENAEGAEG